ncbi:hypothetical protein ACGFT2_33200 [Streptomyces sp. NPDC048514]|uniref:hypothetical protein n=1 Tax=Streptomyces sp. NPDC048514 TaxID=3365564 RepID=UPI0037211210
MRRGLVHVLAWLFATGAAVTLSWWGVHTVMEGTVYDPPRALPVTAADVRARDVKPASGAPSASPSPSRTQRAPSSPAPSRSPAGTHSPSSGKPAPASGRVKAYDTDGGRAVFELGASSATLVSATPGAGWSMQLWKTQTWIRVEFGRGADRVSVFCTWHDGPPRVEVGTY